MSDRIELRVHDFIAEGRDESKSHVVLEIAQPAPGEQTTHGHFFALAELERATPKTIQMVRAWIEFAIEGYYKSAPTNLESHFETILNQLNMQSALYLRQHAHEDMHLIIAAVCNSTLYLAVHGTPAAMLLYRKDGTWRWMDLVDAAPHDGGQLFSQIMNGAMRVDDRFLLATPHVTEFFSADRLAKISEGKSVEEVNDHMSKILRGLSSDYSFAGVWLRQVRSFDETKEAAAQRDGATPPPRRASSSMNELMNKSKNTETILAPPVLTIPKDKIITNAIQLSVRAAKNIAHWCVVAVRWCGGHVRRPNLTTMVGAAAPHRRAAAVLRTQLSTLLFSYRRLPQRRKYILLGASAVLALAIIAVVVVAIINSSSSARVAQAAQLTAVRDQLRAAQESFTFQNEAAARQSLAAAQAQFALLPSRVRSSDDGETLARDLAEKRNTILRITPITLSAAPGTESITARDLVSAGSGVAVLTDTQDIILIKDKPRTLTRAAGAHSILFDDSGKRLIAVSADRAMTAVTLDTGARSTLNVSRLPQDTDTAAAIIYSGRLYSYSDATRQIYRYDATGNGFSGGSAWIKDNSKPADVTQIVADTSLWLRTSAGALMKYTAGKSQPLRVSGAVPDVTSVAHIVSGAGTTIYALDTLNHRVLAIDRDGALVRQYVFDEKTTLKKIAVDKNETTVTGVTDNGRLVRFEVLK